MLRLVAVSLWGAAFLAGIAQAAGLPVSATSLGAGAAVAVPCDGNGVGLRYQLDSAEKLVSVTLVGVNSGCAGGTARVTLTDGATVLADGTASLPDGGFDGSVIVTLDTSVVPGAVTRTAVVIDAP